LQLFYGKLLLHDSGAGDSSALSGLNGSLEQIVQVVNKPRAKEVELIPRGNVSTPHSFEVARVHANEASALEYLPFHALEVQLARGDLRIVAGPRTGAQRTVWFTAVFRRLTWRHTGVRTFHRYEFECGAPRKKA
jgi:hypothetical protein